MLYSLSEELFAKTDVLEEVKLFSMDRAFQSGGLDARNVLLSYHLVLVSAPVCYILFADFSFVVIIKL